MRAADVAVQPVLELAENLVRIVGLLRLTERVALLVDLHAQLSGAADDLHRLGVALGARALRCGLVGLLAVLPLGEIELRPTELIAEVQVGPPAVGAHGGARRARAVNAVAHRAPARRLGNSEDDTTLLVDLALVGSHPAGTGAGAPLEDDLLAFLGRVVLADDGPLGAAGALHTIPGSDDAGHDRNSDGRFLCAGCWAGEDGICAVAAPPMVAARTPTVIATIVEPMDGIRLPSEKVSLRGPSIMLRAGAGEPGSSPCLHHNNRWTRRRRGDIVDR